MSALDSAVRAGKALYAGISNYNPEQTARAAAILRRLGTPCLIHQMKYSMFVRTAERGLFERSGHGRHRRHRVLAAGAGPVDRPLRAGIPDGSRASKPGTFLKQDGRHGGAPDAGAGAERDRAGRGQTLAQMALAWVLRHGVMASALVGASRVEQIGAMRRCSKPCGV